MRRSTLGKGLVIAVALTASTLPPAVADAGTEDWLVALAEVLEDRANAAVMKSLETSLVSEICGQDPQRGGAHDRNTFQRTCQLLQGKRSLADPQTLRTFTEEAALAAAPYSYFGRTISRAVALPRREAVKITFRRLAKAELDPKPVDAADRPGALPTQDNDASLDLNPEEVCPSLKSSRRRLASALKDAMQCGPLSDQAPTPVDDEAYRERYETCRALNDGRWYAVYQSYRRQLYDKGGSYRSAKSEPCERIYHDDAKLAGCRFFRMAQIASRVSDAESGVLNSDRALRRLAYFLDPLEQAIFDDAVVGHEPAKTALLSYRRDIVQFGDETAVERLRRFYVLRFIASVDHAAHLAATDLVSWLARVTKDMDDPKYSGCRLLEGSALEFGVLNGYVQHARNDMKSILTLKLLAEGESQLDGKATHPGCRSSELARDLVALAEHVVGSRNVRAPERIAEIYHRAKTLLEPKRTPRQDEPACQGKSESAGESYTQLKSPDDMMMLDEARAGEFVPWISTRLRKKHRGMSSRSLTVAQGMLAAFEANSPEAAENSLREALDDANSREITFDTLRFGIGGVFGVGLPTQLDELGVPSIGLHLPTGFMLTRKHLGIIAYPLDVGAYARVHFQQQAEPRVDASEPLRFGATAFVRFACDVPISAGVSADLRWSGMGADEHRLLVWLGLDLPLLTFN